MHEPYVSKVQGYAPVLGVISSRIYLLIGKYHKHKRRFLMGKSYVHFGPGTLSLVPAFICML